MARLMKKVPELMIIIKGLLASVRSVGCTAILQVLILYVWSIIFVAEYHEAEEEGGPDIDADFGTMGKSMFSLFIYGTVLDDVTYCTDGIRGTDNMAMLGLFIVFVLISSFTILNMLIGILCEVVSATAESEKTKAAESQVKKAIQDLFNNLDVDKSGNITEDEFMQMRSNPAVCEALEEMDIHDCHFARYCELLFHRTGGAEEGVGKGIGIDEDTLINMILRLSPGNHINALDFSLLQGSIDSTQESLRDRILKIHELVAESAKKSGTILPRAPQQAPQNKRGSFDMEGIDEDGFAEDMRMASRGESPPPPPSADGKKGSDLRGTAQAKQYTVDDFIRTSSHEIIQELERRLGTSVSAFAEPQKQKAEPQQAFHSLGVPQMAE